MGTSCHKHPVRQRLRFQHSRVASLMWPKPRKKHSRQTSQFWDSMCFWWWMERQREVLWKVPQSLAAHRSPDDCVIKLHTTAAAQEDRRSFWIKSIKPCFKSLAFVGLHDWTPGSGGDSYWGKDWVWRKIEMCTAVEFVMRTGLTVAAQRHYG